MTTSPYYLQGTCNKRAPFSFHCRICYERLNLTDRAPVVLPCGHTYICAECSSKLTKCMECRTRLVPLVKKTPPPLINNYHGTRRVHFRQQQPLPVPTTHDELAQAIQASDAAPAMPRNVVLMALLEATQGHNGSNSTANTDDSGYDSGDDDALVFQGMNTLTAVYGTYVVKDRAGLWVYPMPPPPHENLPQLDELEESSIVETASKDPPASTYGSTKLQAVRSLRKDRRRKQQEQRRQQQLQQDEDDQDDDQNDVNVTINSSTSKKKHRFALLRQQQQLSNSSNTANLQPIQRLTYGETVQVVSFQDQVAKLASSAGYVRVPNEDQLVKIGEPEDEACRMEGLIFTMMDEKKVCKARISLLNKWEKQLHTELRRYLKKQAELESIQRQQALQHDLEQQRIMSKHDGAMVAQAKLYGEHPTSMELLLSNGSSSSSSPPPQLLEMSPSSNTSSPETPAQGRRREQQQYLNDHYDRHYSHHPDQNPDFLQEARRVSQTLNDSASYPRKQNQSQQESSSFPWDEDFLARGCDLFFCATMPLCVGSTPIASPAPLAAGIPHSHSLLAQPSSNTTSPPDVAAGPARYTFDTTPHHQYQRHHQPPPLCRSHSTESADGNASTLSCNDNSTVTSVDFATGLSGHWGLSSARARAHQTQAPRKEVRMMSQHDGIAHIRVKKLVNASGGRHYPQQHQPYYGDCGSTCGSSKASIATL